MEKTATEIPLISWIGKTSKLIQICIQHALVKENINLTFKQLMLLKFLDSNDGQIQNDLAIITGRNKGSLVRLIHNMEKKGLVIRTKDPMDKRINRIYLTSHGSKVFESTLPMLNRIIDIVQEGISTQDKNHLISVLSRIQSNIKQQHFCVTKNLK